MTEYGRKHTEEKALIARAELDRVIAAAEYNRVGGVTAWAEYQRDRAAALAEYNRATAAAAAKYDRAIAAAQENK